MTTAHNLFYPVAVVARPHVPDVRAQAAGLST
jgi:hypothetical protein